MRPSVKARLAMIGTVLFLGLQRCLHAADITLPALTDLREDAQQVRRTREPLIVLFSLPGCPYCKAIRQSYLAPLLREPPAGHPVHIREVDITSKAVLTGLQGEVMTQAQFAAHHKIKVTPVVLMLDANGVPLADPLVGGDTAGFYGSYFDNALERSRKALAMPPESRSGSTRQ
jgi:thioredoxin-related protein